MNVSIKTINSIKNGDNQWYITILYRLNLYFQRKFVKIVGLIQVYANDIVFTLKISFLYKSAINYLLFPFFNAIFFISIRYIFTFCVFLYKVIYIQNIARAITNVSQWNQILYLWELS